MNLKAKLEAVIYAAEEPVALAQLAELFGAEALEWKAAREAAASAADQAQPPVLPEEPESLGLDQPPAAAEQAGRQEAERQNPAGIDGSPNPATAPDADEQQDTEDGLKRLARQRDREIKAVLRGLLDEIIAGYESDERGVEVKEIAGGYRMATKPACHDAVRLFIKSLKPPLRLSLPALETLAVIAYKQPVTAPEVNEIRGVESAGVLGSLLGRKLIATAGRKPVIGRPILYKTTREFLLRFGLKDISELPSMEEFEKMAAIELEESAEAEVDDPAGAYGVASGSAAERGEDADDFPDDRDADEHGGSAAGESKSPLESGTAADVEAEAGSPLHD
ncbi:MAG TPA: SMC-Scp complex subunit ScpB [Terracidiphilus sp.]|nr:SMC-Scp complex subunit ScpB [Terracidiphilus sp.]